MSQLNADSASFGSSITIPTFATGNYPTGSLGQMIMDSTTGLLPSDKVISIAQEIIKYGAIKRAWIGDFRFRGISYKDNKNKILQGLLVIGNDKTINGGLEYGDIIVKIKGASALWGTFIAAINSIKPGEEIELEVVRRNKLIDLKIVTVLKPDY